jgi:predicted  nucleic acid-binding Zn-ribbon protein
MKEQILKDFETYTKEELEVAKNKLNAIPSTGTISNYSSRFTIFSETIKYLNDEFVSHANKIIQSNSEINDLNDDLFNIAKRTIEDYIKYFKG